MIRLFKRRSPAHRAEPRATQYGYTFTKPQPTECVPCLAQDEAYIVDWFGFTPEEWSKLGRTSQVKFRDSFYSAQGL